MKRYGDLFPKIVTFENIQRAYKKAVRGKRFNTSVILFYFHLENEIIQLKSELENLTYRPRPHKTFKVYEPKERVISSSDFRDRVVHHSICHYLGPILERQAIFDTYACFRGKGTHRAIKRAQAFSQRHTYYLKCDIRKYFESISHDVLKNILRKKIKDQKLLQLLDVIIEHQPEGYNSGVGLPIGNLTSQYFANLYLGEMDYFIKQDLKVGAYLRYMDDFICFSNDKEMLWDILRKIEKYVGDKLKLELKATVTKIAPVSEGVPFLGMRIFPNLIRLKRENLVRLRRKIKIKEQLYGKGKIGPQDLSQSVKSMLAHISHVDSLGLRSDLFEKSFNI